MHTPTPHATEALCIAGTPPTTPEAALGMLTDVFRGFAVDRWGERLQLELVGMGCAVADLLAHDCVRVRVEALRALGAMGPETVRRHAAKVAAAVDDGDPRVQYLAANRMRLLTPRELRSHAQTLLAVATDATLTPDVRCEATGALTGMGTAGRDLGPGIATMLGDEDWTVRHRALAALRGLGPEAVAEAAGAVLLRLEDAHAEVRRAAVATLGAMRPSDFVAHAADAAVRAKIATDPNERVGAAARAVRTALNWRQLRRLVRAERFVSWWAARPLASPPGKKLRSAQYFGI